MLTYGITVVAKQGVLVKYVITIIQYCGSLKTATGQSLVASPGNRQAFLTVFDYVLELDTQYDRL